jgi:hypothetical protein
MKDELNTIDKETKNEKNLEPIVKTSIKALEEPRLCPKCNRLIKEDNFCYPCTWYDYVEKE